MGLVNCANNNILSDFLFVLFLLCVCAARNHDSQYEFTIYLVEEKKKTICIYGDACIGCELRLINLTQSN